MPGSTVMLEQNVRAPRALLTTSHAAGVLSAAVSVAGR